VDYLVVNVNRVIFDISKRLNMKIYNNFCDKYGNNYRFDNYMDFAQFWFNLSRKVAVIYFPQFNDLQKAAASSKEARTKI
jgi:hypothetical protein